MESTSRAPKEHKPHRENLKVTQAVPFAISFAVHMFLFFGIGTMIVFEGQLPRPNFLDFDPGMFVQPMDEVIMEQAPELQTPDAAGEAVAADVKPMASQTAPSLDLVTTASTSSSSSVFNVSSLPAMGNGLPVNLGSKQAGKPRVGVPGGRISRVSFFGIKQETRRVAFLIDVSQSMADQSKGGLGNYRKLKEVVNARVQGLDEGTYFNLIFFSGGNSTDVFQSEMVLATPDNKASAVKFLDPYMKNVENAKKGLFLRNYKPGLHGLQIHGRGGGSRVDVGLAAAFEMAADVMFIVSDGEPRIFRPLTSEEQENRQEKFEDRDEEKAQERAEARKAWLEKYRAWEKASPELAKDATEALGEGGIKISKNWPGEPIPPGGGIGGHPRYGTEQLVAYIKKMSKELYEPRGMKPPVVHAIAWGESENVKKGRPDFLKNSSEVFKGEYVMVNPRKDLGKDD